MQSPDGKKILVIDDEKNLVEFIQSVLTTRGHQVITANNGQEGLKRLSEGDPNLMILDVSMPKMGGVQLYSQICSRFGRTRFPVIVLTALEAMTDFFEDALVDRFMTKPFRVKELLDAIDLLLSPEGRPLVWIIDADAAAVGRMVESIRAERFNVKESRTVSEALASLSSQPPQFIFLQRDAWSTETLLALNSVEALRNVPRIAYSHRKSAETADAPAGADAYLEKIDDLKPAFMAMRQLQKKAAERRV